MSPKYGVNALGGMRYAMYKCRSADSIHVWEAQEMDEERMRQERKRAGEEARCVGWLQGAARCLLYKSCLELRENERRGCYVRNEGFLKQATKVRKERERKSEKRAREKKKGMCDWYRSEIGLWFIEFSGPVPDWISRFVQETLNKEYFIITNHWVHIERWIMRENRDKTAISLGC